jgi:hypothetical protein
MSGPRGLQPTLTMTRMYRRPNTGTARNGALSPSRTPTRTQAATSL